MGQLHDLQQEILNYFLDKKEAYQILDQNARDDLGIYKSLVLNSVEKYLPIAFKSTYVILADQWREIVKDYMEQYPSHSPVYFVLAKDFPIFLASDFFKSKYSYPEYLSELALYEWTELELYNATEPEKDTSKVNPCHKILKLKYPISEIICYIKDSSVSLEEKRTTDIEIDSENLIIYRDPDTLQIRFFSLSTETLFVLEKIISGMDIGKTIQEFCNTNNLELNPELEKSFFALITNLKKLKILIE